MACNRMPSGTSEHPVPIRNPHGYWSVPDQQDSLSKTPHVCMHTHDSYQSASGNPVNPVPAFVHAGFKVPDRKDIRNQAEPTDMTHNPVGSFQALRYTDRLEARNRGSAQLNNY